MLRKVLGIQLGRLTTATIQTTTTNCYISANTDAVLFIAVGYEFLSVHSDDMLATGFRAGRPRDRGSSPFRVQYFCLRCIPNISREPLSLLFRG